MSDDGKLGRRAFLGAATAGVAAALAACSSEAKPTAAPATTAGKAATPRRSAAVAENARPGDPHWEIRQLGAAHEIEGYAGKASVLPGESFPLFVSTTALRLPGDARSGWAGTRGTAPARCGSPARCAATGRTTAVTWPEPTNTVQTDWDPALDVPTDDWPRGLLPAPAGRGLRGAAVRAGDRPVGEHGREGRAQERRRRPGRRTTPGAATTCTRGRAVRYASRSLAVSLDRPYDAERRGHVPAPTSGTRSSWPSSWGLPLAYVTSMDIAADPHLLDGASALISPRATTSTGPRPSAPT